ncbi:Regulator of Ty1 transposition protein 10 [Candida viswanathii]|uniref:Regulator of Ty1 transposition protein 10 n=1 Tax=Candida viswanathii TaxID=5486 RepID=A0A367YRQ7_9ASCO|nr:Regulator of Ty1 transposition protein 10 [Candida viswanathii]
MTISEFNLISSKKEDRFHKLYHYGPVTCLKIHQDYVIAGYGPILKIFRVDDLSRTTLVFSQQVFRRNKIHHIDVNKTTGKMVISGAQSFMVLRFSDLIESHQAATLLEKTINEWITTSYVVDDDHILLLNSHNTVIKVDTRDYSVVAKIDCNEKSILYSGSIAKLDNGEIYVAAGTVMSGVIIWNLDSREIRHTLTAHEGSIFGVKIDPTGTYIVSCSDDRSIKLYSFEDGAVLSTGWGHGSRIWNLSFFEPEGHLLPDSIKVVSCGEDCTLRVWEYIPGNELLIQRELWENYHRGKHIWSGDVDNLRLNLAVTGGADGKIRLHDLNPQSMTRYPLHAIADSINVSFNKSEFIRDYFELQDSNVLVLLTSSGHVVYCSNGSFSSIGQFSEFSQFGIVGGFPGANVVAIGASNGDILCVDFNSTVPQVSWIKAITTIIGQNKVKNLHFSCISGRFFVLVDCPNPKVPFVLVEFEYSIQGMGLLRMREVPKTDPRFPLTSFTVDVTNNWLILASKKVSIQVVDLESLDTSIFRKLSPGDTISSVSVTKSRDRSADLLVLARDGTYTIARVNLLRSEFSLDILQQNKITRGFIEGGFMHHTDLILYGFKSSYFFVWNETKQIEIMNENCGGSGHRNFKFYTNAQNDTFKFIYTSKDELCSRTHSVRFKENFGLVQNGTHGREIRDLAISRDTKLVVTSSEDSSICISKLASTGEMTNVWSMNNHMSGMQKIKFLNDAFVASSAANEEFIIWKLTWLDDVPMLAEYNRLQPTKSVPDLRVMDFCSFETSNGFVLATVYSDSNVKVWNFDFKSGFEQIDSFFYSSCCILNCAFIELKDTKYLVLGTTDGFVSFWDLSGVTSRKGNAKMAASKQLHQSGVKALELLEDNYSYTMVTGGDDNSIVVSRIVAAEADDGIVLSVETVDGTASAASATITSIAALSHDRFVATSVDQVVRLWSFAHGRLECHGATYTTVADTGCCDATTIDGKDVVVIGGAGISSWIVD